MIGNLAARVAAALDAQVDPAVRALAATIAREADARAVLFYGSNLRTRSLDGVLDFYVLTHGAIERGIWPIVEYREAADGAGLRAKIATMTLATFAHAAADRMIDTTIWTRFVQPCALVWAAGDEDRRAVAEAIAAAAITAARYAAALGPDEGCEGDYWRALFRATYAAELRVEARGREAQILEFGAEHFAGLLPLAWSEGGVDHTVAPDGLLRPVMPAQERRRWTARWRLRQRLGKPLNVMRLIRAAFTFGGAARYAAWKIERHTGVAVPLTPWRERHPILAAPGVLWRVWRARKRPNR